MILATIEQFLGIDGMGRTAPATAQQLLEAASDAWVSETEREWHYTEDIVEHVPGFGTGKLHVSRAPLVGVSELLFDGQVISSDLYRVDSDSGAIIRTDGLLWRWTARATTDITKDKVAGTERALYKVTYDGGYVTRAQVDVGLPQTLPSSVERQVLDCAVALYWRRGRDTSLAAKSTARGNVSYRDDGLPSSFIRAAHRARRYTP